MPDEEADGARLLVVEPDPLADLGQQGEAPLDVPRTAPLADVVEQERHLQQVVAHDPPQDLAFDLVAAGPRLQCVDPRHRAERVLVDGVLVIRLESNQPGDLQELGQERGQHLGPMHVAQRLGDVAGPLEQRSEDRTGARVGPQPDAERRHLAPGEQDQPVRRLQAHALREQEREQQPHRVLAEQVVRSGMELTMPADQAVRRGPQRRRRHVTPALRHQAVDLVEHPLQRLDHDPGMAVILPHQDLHR